MPYAYAPITAIFHVSMQILFPSQIQNKNYKPYPFYYISAKLKDFKSLEQYCKHDHFDQYHRSSICYGVPLCCPDNKVVDMLVDPAVNPP
jgi:hypothetical protein